MEIGFNKPSIIYKKMKSPKILHREAMKYAQDAFIEEVNENDTKAFDLYEKAFELEREAALNYLNKDIEPTRSVLFRSAASLAKNIKKYFEAIDLIEKGLSGNPPIEIEKEFQLLYNQISRAISIQLIEELKSIKNLKKELNSIHSLLELLVVDKFQNSTKSSKTDLFKFQNEISI